MATGRPLGNPGSRRLPHWLRLDLPSWLVSMVVHALLLVLLLVSVKAQPRGLGGGFGGFEVGSLGDGAGSGGDYFEDDGGGGPAATVNLAADTAPAGDLFDTRPPIDAVAALPSMVDDRAASGEGPTPPPRAGGTGLATSAGGFTSGTGAGSGSGSGNGSGRGAVGSGGRTRTGVYGIEAEGHKFVYVFDRSGSMGGSSRNSPLNSAKAQLLASLEYLGELNQFQIIFYNEKPTMFAIAGHPDRLVFGTAANKASAQQFIRGIVADGGTRHEEALWAALKLHPDVIFFLTDADQPELSPAQLEKVRRANSGQCSINTIEFGLGPQLERENFLVQLARENNGRHTYVDVSKIGAAP